MIVMRKQLLMFVCAGLVSALGAECRAQDWNEVQKAPDAYMWAEGTGDTVEDADRQALEHLVSMIGVSVSSRYESFEGQSGSAYSSRLENSLSTYTFASLSNTGVHVLARRPQARVVRWIARSEVNAMLEQRRSRVLEYVDCALRAETALKIDDALRTWSWALALLQTVPDGTGMEAETADGKRTLSVWIPERMNAIFDALKAEVVGYSDGMAQLRFTFNGAPVSSVDYSFFDGRGWSGQYSARDGRGVADLGLDKCPEHIQIRYEYAYAGEAHVDREVADVIAVLGVTPMRRSQTTALFKRKGRRWTPDVPIGKNLSGELASRVKAVAEAVSSGDAGSMEDLFTQQGYEMLKRLCAYGRAQVMDFPELKMVRLENGGVSVRSIPMVFRFGSRTFVENVVLSFDEELKVSSLAFSLDRQSSQDIWAKTMWPEDTRIRIIEFMEDFRTAYALKRLDYIRDVFDDDAVIIVGKVSSKAPVGGDRVALPQLPSIRRERYSKDQYLRNLERCFDANEYINVRFSRNDVQKAGVEGEVYGIQIQQDWNSSTYGDRGYLFLVLDMNDADTTRIHVRTWQPHPDPVDGLFDLSKF